MRRRRRRAVVVEVFFSDTKAGSWFSFYVINDRILVMSTCSKLQAAQQ